jgi:predicted pyridoxine 5'-phosphate oxidase superfamily flavin-nucleotide-binding protein
MTDSGGPSGFHAGEVAVQRRVGVHAEARRLTRMLEPAALTDGVARFLEQRTLAVITARDEQGRLWTSPLARPGGLLEVADAVTLHVHAVPGVGDPLHRLGVGQPVGLIALDLAQGRRFRLNGRLAGADRTGLTVHVEQAYGNCPQYLQRRVLRAEPAPRVTAARPGAPVIRTDLSADDVRLIRSADTFFLGTTHPTSGNDASHRGGPPGFVRVVGDRALWWPDYAGNNLFNSLGNLEADPTASLLFVDFATGRRLHLTGRAALELTDVGVAGDDGLTGRIVRFATDLVTTGEDPALLGGPVAPYPRNPPLRG